MTIKDNLSPASTNLPGPFSCEKAWWILDRHEKIVHCRNNLQKLPTYQIGWKWYPILGSNKNSQQNVGHEVPYSKSAYLQQDLWYWSTWLDSNLFLNILPLAVLPLCGSLCFRCLFGYLVASCWQGHMKLWTERNYSLVAQDVWKTCRSIGSSNLCQDSHRSQNTSSNGPFSLLCSFTKVYETYVLRSPPPSSSLFLLQFLSIHVFPGFPIGQWQKSLTFCVIEVTLFSMGVSRRIPRNRKLPYQEMTWTYVFHPTFWYLPNRGWVRATCSRGVENSTAIGPSSKPAALQSDTLQTNAFPESVRECES